MPIGKLAKCIINSVKVLKFFVCLKKDYNKETRNIFAWPPWCLYVVLVSACCDQELTVKKKKKSVSFPPSN